MGQLLTHQLRSGRTGVWTDENARRSGYGQQVSKAWASEVTGEGRVAFYSHLDDDQPPSRRLASKLGVVHLFDLANFTRPAPSLSASAGR